MSQPQSRKVATHRRCPSPRLRLSDPPLHWSISEVQQSRCQFSSKGLILTHRDIGRQNCCTAQRGYDPMCVRGPSAAQFAHSAKLPSVMGDDIALREGGV
jgi:hypothetical protein